MVEKIKETKDQVLQKMEQAIAERGVERMDVTEMDALKKAYKTVGQELKVSYWKRDEFTALQNVLARHS